jgi:hypothetical protein
LYRIFAKCFVPFAGLEGIIAVSLVSAALFSSCAFQFALLWAPLLCAVGVATVLER